SSSRVGVWGPQRTPEAAAGSPPVIPPDRIFFCLPFTDHDFPNHAFLTCAGPPSALSLSRNIKGTIMAALTLRRKLAILSDAAKYDASCASSGSEKRNSAGTGGIGSTEASGIYHSYAPDGSCITQLKIPLTNFNINDSNDRYNRT